MTKQKHEVRLKRAALGRAMSRFRQARWCAFKHYTFLGYDAEVAYTVKRQGRGFEFWRWSEGQEGDVCIECGKDLSGYGLILCNYDYAMSQALCPECVGMVV